MGKREISCGLVPSTVQIRLLALMMLNDVNPAKRRSLILNAAIELKKVQTLAVKERIFVEDIVSKITYRELSSTQIRWLESLTEKYGIIAR